MHNAPTTSPPSPSAPRRALFGASDGLKVKELREASTIREIRVRVSESESECQSQPAEIMGLREEAR